MTQTTTPARSPDSGQSNARIRAVEDAVAPLVLLAFAAASSNFMDFSAFSDDQKTYIRIATQILSASPAWGPADSFAWILAGVYRIWGDWARVFSTVYCVFAAIYLTTAYACMRWMRIRPVPALAATLVSVVPHYTLGMTSWGFAGAEFVTARIAVVPIAAFLMTAYLLSRDARRSAWLLPVAAACSFIHLSSAFLFAILLTACLITDFRPLRRILKDAAAPLAASAAIFVVLAYRLFFLPVPVGFDPVLLDVYQQLAVVQGPRIDALDPRATVDLLWEAAYAGFWWTMFPPRLGDVAYALGENALLLMALWLGWTRRAWVIAPGTALPGRMAALAIGVVVTAYGFQAANFMAWKAAGAEPRLFEEVRAFGFLYWPLYAIIGLTFERLGKSLLNGVIFLALLISPTAAIRRLPEESRISMASAAMRYGPSNLNPEYVEKALGLYVASRRELESLGEALRHSHGDAPCRVLSLEHELKRSGCTVLISYQDKRAGRVGAEGTNALLVWYLSYEEISSAIESRDPDRLLQAALRFNASVVVSRWPIGDPRFALVFSGSRWHAYRIAP